jgi:hypothetical protein
MVMVAVVVAVSGAVEQHKGFLTLCPRGGRKIRVGPTRRRQLRAARRRLLLRLGLPLTAVERKFLMFR